MSLPGFANRKLLIVNSLKKAVNCHPFDKLRMTLSPSKGQLSTVNCNQGFSLIELLVVISIIGVLVSFGSVSWTNAQQKARDARRKADLKSVQQAMELYFQANGKYPDASPTGQVQCNVTGDTSNKTWGGSFICGPITYMQQLPKDPTNVSQYAYYPKPYTTVPIGYRLYANLENTNDPEYLTPPPGCDTAHGNYCTQNP